MTAMKAKQDKINKLLLFLKFKLLIYNLNRREM